MRPKRCASAVATSSWLRVGYGKLSPEAAASPSTRSCAPRGQCRHPADAGAEVPSPPRREPKRSVAGVRVQGEADILVRFAKCCSPVPGDDIVGFISRGRG